MMHNPSNNPQDYTLDTTEVDTQDVPVLLRAWRSGGGVFAILPTLTTDEYGRYCQAICQAYAMDGTCCEISIGVNYWRCIRQSRPATSTEGAPLFHELERIGYRPRKIQRATASMHAERSFAGGRMYRAMRTMRGPE